MFITLEIQNDSIKEALQGLGEDTSSISDKFWSYWNSVKGSINKILGLDTGILDMQKRYTALRDKAIATGNKVLEDSAEQGIRKSIALKNQHKTLADKIKDYLPAWLKIDALQPKGVNGLGFVFLLPAWAIASLIGGGLVALVYVSTTGMDMLRSYEAQKQVLDQLEKGTITASQAKTLIEAASPQSGFTSKIAEGFGSGLGSTLPWILGGITLLGVGYLYFTMPSISKKQEVQNG